jgi:hypothetical protein
VAEGFEEAVVVEPPDPFQRDELYVHQALPWPSSPNHLRLKEADHHLGQRVGIAVIQATHRRLDACLSQSVRAAHVELTLGITNCLASVFPPARLRSRRGNTSPPPAQVLLRAVLTHQAHPALGFQLRCRAFRRRTSGANAASRSMSPFYPPFLGIAQLLQAGRVAHFWVRA